MEAVLPFDEQLFDAKRVAVVMAHPDDESFLTAGIVHRIVATGGVVWLLCATAGEQGKAYVAEELHAGLGALRRKELQDVVSLLGIERCSVLGIPDGQVKAHIAALTDACRQWIRDMQPSVALSFDADGFTGHGDHIAVYDAARAVCEDVGVPFAKVSMPPAPWCDEIKAVLERKRIHGVYDATAVNSAPVLHVPVSAEQKLAAIRSYSTQLRGLDPYNLFRPECAEHFLQNEYFTIEQFTKK